MWWVLIPGPGIWVMEEHLVERVNAANRERSLPRLRCEQDRRGVQLVESGIKSLVVGNKNGKVEMSAKPGTGFCRPQKDRGKWSL